ncbi:MAG: chemotaxis protein CheW [Myxococcota bacterium]
MPAEGSVADFDSILSEIERRRQADKTENVNENAILVVIFSCGGRLFAFKGIYVKEIIPFIKINAVPGCPPVFLGIFNLRGTIESIASMHSLLGMTVPEFNPEQKILVIESEGMRTGLLVDAVEDVTEIPENEIQRSVFENENVFVSGETMRTGRHITVIDAAVLLKKLVQSRLDKGDS